MKESEVRDYIVDHFKDFRSLITNHSQFKKDLKKELKEIKKRSKKAKQILISDLIKMTVIEKLRQGLPILKNLELIDKEFVLLKTDSGRGKQPSVDILAYNSENYCVALLELKISDSAEREAVTELSAYNQGLQNSYRGLSALEVLWIPISTEWRTTTKAAIEFEILWQNSLVMPLKLNVDYNTVLSKVNSVELNCFNPVKDVTEIECLNLFSYECYEAFDYCTMNKVPNKKAFINYVTSICARQKINGFIIFHKPVNLMFPYGFTLCVFNPYKGSIHKRISKDFADREGEKKYYDLFKESNVINCEFTDVDFRTHEIKHYEPSPEELYEGSFIFGSYWEKDFLNVGSFAENSENLNITYVINKIKKAIDSNKENSRAFGTPNFEGLIRSLKREDVDSVIYLGVHSELISNKIMLESKIKKETKDFFRTISSFKYMRKNFKHYNMK